MMAPDRRELEPHMVLLFFKYLQGIVKPFGFANLYILLKIERQIASYLSYLFNFFYFIDI